MRINIGEEVAGSADWERSSMASGFSVNSKTNQAYMQAAQLLKERLSTIPKPKNKFEITDEQIAQLEEDMQMEE